MSGVWNPDVTMTLVFGVVGVIVAVLGFRFRGSICFGVSRMLQFARERTGNAKSAFTLKKIPIANENLDRTDPYIGDADVELALQESSFHAMSTSISVTHIRNVFEIIDWLNFDDPEILIRDELRAWQD